MLLIDDTLTFKTAHIDLDWDKLIALTNTQGRLINNSSNPCSNNAALTTGRFIHIEQCFNLRNSTASRKKLSDAVGMTFPEDKITVLSPNGFELLRSGEVTPITWSTTGFVGNVKLEYTTNNGVSWMLITASTVNNGTYNWNVPQIGTWKEEFVFPITETAISLISVTQYLKLFILFIRRQETLFLLMPHRLLDQED
jgi:hypothetical protein